MGHDLGMICEKYKDIFALIIGYDYRNEPLVILDLTKNNNDLRKVDVNDAVQFSAYIDDQLKKYNSRIGICIYMEDRSIYQSPLFKDRMIRTIHLGIDLWVDSCVEVFVPMDGIVHSFQNNKGKGDYGPTIVMEHTLDDITFYTLYGHLSISSLDDKAEGKIIKRGKKIGEVGTFPDNGDYPSHVHFEIITDMQGKKGDFPGVASKEQINKYRVLCPDPNMILQIDEL